MDDPLVSKNRKGLNGTAMDDSIGSSDNLGSLHAIRARGHRSFARVGYFGRPKVGFGTVRFGYMSLGLVLGRQTLTRL